MKKNNQNPNLGIDELNYKNLVDYIANCNQQKIKQETMIENKNSFKENEEKKNEIISRSSTCNGRIENGSNFVEVIEEKDNISAIRDYQEIPSQPKVEEENKSKVAIEKENFFHVKEDYEEEVDDEDVVITMKEFDQTVDRILQKFADYLINDKKSVKDFFTNNIIQVTKTSNTFTDGISLKEFVIAFNQIKIEMNTLDIYCIFTKLKMSEDDDEIIDLNKLCEEMLNYGIFEENSNNIWNGNTSLRKTDLYEKNKNEEIQIDDEEKNDYSIKF